MKNRVFAFAAACAVAGWGLLSFAYEATISSETVGGRTGGQRLYDAVVACEAAGGGTIYLEPGTYSLTSSEVMNKATYAAGGTTVNSPSHLYATKPLTLVGKTGDAHWPTDVTIQGDGSARFLWVVGIATVKNLKIVGFKACDRPDLTPDGGNLTEQCLAGAIHFSGAQSLATNCTFVGNSARGGGALRNGNAIDCYFTGNHSDYAGGCVCNTTLRSCKFVENYSLRYGVGWWISAGVFDCECVGNYATDGSGIYGGCFYTAQDNVISNTTFVGNHGTSGCLLLHKGNRVYDCTFKSNFCAAALNNAYCAGVMTVTGNDSTGLKVFGCTFEGNSCTTNGPGVTANNTERNAGVVYSDYTDETKIPWFLNCTFVGNEASANGGACVGGSYSNCVFAGNRSGSSAGAVRLFANGRMIDCILTNNVAYKAGAVSGTDLTARVTGCLFRDNVATREAGALSGCWVSNCTFVCNRSGERGGAVFLNANTRLYDSAFLTNSVTGGTDSYGGGAVATDSGGDTVRIDGCTFVGNFLTGSSSYNFYGGAINDSSTVGCKVWNSKFVDNHAAGKHGGACYGGGYSNCWFVGNWIEGDYGNGGALCGKNWPGEYVLDCHFVSNRIESATTTGYAGSGGAYYSMLSKTTLTNLIRGCTFAYNWQQKAVDKGIVSFERADVPVVDCAFETNCANGRIVIGGACSNCRFVGNEVPGGSGVLYGGSASNCVFRDNGLKSRHFGLFAAVTSGAVDACWSDLVDCDCDGGAFMDCTLNRCEIHDITNADVASRGLYCVFLDNNHVTNCLVRDIHMDGVNANGLVNIRSGAAEVTKHRFVSSTFVNDTFVHYTVGMADVSGDNKGSIYSFSVSGTSPVLMANCLLIDGRNQYNAHREISCGTANVNFSIANTVVGAINFGDFTKTSYASTGGDLGGNRIDNAISNYGFVGDKAAKKNAPEYSLLRTSPYRDYADGVGTFAAGALDLAGRPRVDDNGKVDLGCYQCWIVPVGMTLLIR